MTTETVNIFEKASRLALRFDTPVGKMSVEQLWELPLTSKAERPNLDTIAVELNTKLETQRPKSFVNAEKKNETLQLQFDIVKHIIDTRIAENQAKLEAASRKESVAELDELIRRKKQGELEGKSLEELQQMRAEVLNG